MWRCRGSNPGPFTCKANALPLSYIPHCDEAAGEAVTPTTEAERRGGRRTADIERGGGWRRVVAPESAFLSARARKGKGNTIRKGYHSIFFRSLISVCFVNFYFFFF